MVLSSFWYHSGILVFLHVKFIADFRMMVMACSGHQFGLCRQFTYRTIILPTMGRERERDQERVLFPAYTRLGWEGEDGGGGDSPFQGIESLLFGQAPDPLLGFAGEGIEGAGDIREVADELLIEVHKAKEGLDLLCLCHGRPFHDSTDLCWIHGDVVF